MTVRAGVVGASGFTGAELLRLIAGHPDLEFVVATGDTQAGAAVADVFPSLAAAYQGVVFQSLAPELVSGLDVVFLGLPHEASMQVAPSLVDDVGCVVDLSAAFRLKDRRAYPQWYGFEHDQPALLAEAVYGLPERHRVELKGARLIAAPGCYVTAATLALAPFLDSGLIEPTGIIVDAVSGVSGAGKAAKANTSFCTVDEDFVAYALLDHRHTPEIEQNLAAEVLFTPHLAPMNRGILATCYARPATGTDPSTASLLDHLHDVYSDEPFVVVTDASPSTKATLGSNCAHVTVRHDPRTGYVIALCALDNLTKGASGGALQSANVALGLEETAGLPLVGVTP